MNTAPNPQDLFARDMLMRDYFAAHAPVMPEWYAKQYAAHIPAPELAQPRDMTSEEEAFYNEWYDDRGFRWLDGTDTSSPLYLALEKWREATEVDWQAYQRACAEYEAAKSGRDAFFTWPYYYADQILDVRNTAQEGEHK